MKLQPPGQMCQSLEQGGDQFRVRGLGEVHLAICRTIGRSGCQDSPISISKYCGRVSSLHVYNSAMLHDGLEASNQHRRSLSSLAFTVYIKRSRTVRLTGQGVTSARSEEVVTDADGDTNSFFPRLATLTSILIRDMTRG